MPTESDVRRLCMALPGVTERSSWGQPAWFTRTLFARMWEEGVLTVIAATIKDDIFLLCRPSLAKLRVQFGPVEALKKFNEEQHRKVKISTNPKGSLSDLVLRYWLDQAMPDYARYVDVINTGSQDQFQHSIISGDVDAAAVFEPLYTITTQLDPTLTIFLSPHEMMADQPGGAISMRGSFISAHPDIVAKIVKLQMKAVTFLKDHPAESAQDLEKYIGLGLVNVATLEKSVRYTHDRFTADPHVLVNSTKVMHDYMRKSGYLIQDVDLNKLFYFSPYDQARKETKP